MKPVAIVALLTPVLAALAGYVADQAARLPGAPQLDRSGLTAVFVAGAAAAAGVGWKLLSHLLGELEREQGHQRELEHVEVQSAADAEAPVAQDPVLVELSKLAAAVGAVSGRLDALERPVSARGQSRRRRVTRS